MRRDVIPLPDDLDVDDDGYPSDLQIDQIRRATDTAGSEQWLTDVFPRLVESIPCGSIAMSEGVDDFNRPIQIIKYSTGGWSGQEDLIDAVVHSIIGTLYLWSWRRGGHYEFRIPIHRNVTKL